MSSEKNWIKRKDGPPAGFCEGSRHAINEKSWTWTLKNRGRLEISGNAIQKAKAYDLSGRSWAEASVTFFFQKGFARDFGGKNRQVR